ncbi:MAG TPA: DUF1289 domain-containing protein [Sedimenticola thiotaurini]|uniref:DUF1289 domain-containing protein n=1 Tax=Sedimenticola thiotaurini TaxID=1543721 RepID=A0A831RLT5_9GAMM|nr:DUF1289 domain-containing protein [Sedimenticola thiotaurini]
MQFSPCKGGENCTQGGTHCQGCGRSHEEIAATRELIAGITRFALEMGYENVEQFTAFVGDKAAKKIRMAQAEQQGGGIGIGIPIGK